MEVVERVLVERAQERVVEPEPGDEGAGEAGGVVGRLLALAGQGERRRVAPDGFAVRPPVADQRPARRRFAGVPLALGERRHAVRRPRVAKASEELDGALELVFAEGGVVPFGGLVLVGRDERRFAPHRQAHVLRLESPVDLGAEIEDAAPHVVGVGERHARALVDARDAVVEAEVARALARHAGDRRGARRPRRAGERDVAFAGEQARRGVEPDPARAGEVDLGPGVQVREVGRRSGRGTVEGLHVGGQLHEVARHEARGEAVVAEDLDEQPAAVAARAAGDVERPLARLHAGLHAHAVGDRALHGTVDLDEGVDDRRLGGGAVGVDPGGQARARGLDLEVRGELVPLGVGVAEREALGRLLDEEVERVDDGELGDEVDDDRELARLLGKDEAGEVVAERVLLPVDEVALRPDRQAVALDRRAAVRGGAQAHDVRPERDRFVVAVDGRVIERDADAHADAVSVSSGGK